MNWPLEIRLWVPKLATGQGINGYFVMKDKEGGIILSALISHSCGQGLMVKCLWVAGRSLSCGRMKE